MSKPNQQLARLPAQDRYQVGYGKPPAASRFKPGQSGNPKGRPTGAKTKKPSLAEERTKTLIMEEAYRTIPILEKGRRISIPIMTAVLRAVAMNAAKGNNRAATLFTTLVSRTEAENRKLVSDAFGAAFDYKLAWGKELERRKKLGLNLPDPIPHPDDIIIDARNMSFRIAGPMTRDEIPRYKLGAELLHAFQESNVELEEKVATLPEGPERQKLKRDIKLNAELVTRLNLHYGPRSERTKDPFVREVEDLVGEKMDQDADDDSGT